MEQQNIKKGLIIGVSAYLIWGVLPMYWKVLDVVSPDVVIAQRIFWSSLFLLLYIIITNRWTLFVNEFKRIVLNKKLFLSVTLASILIALNWLLFIWTVQINQVLQASLGYYINPLMSILLGVIFLKEKLSNVQKLSVLLAAIGVVYLTVSYHVFPWISLVLSTSFALYGLVKKMLNLDATFSLMIETTLLTPIALIYLFYNFGFTFGFQQSSFTIDLLLIGSGIATSLPLLLFGTAVLYMPLSLSGILQYIAPTMMLVIGIILFDEEFTIAHLITFSFIWVSVILYISSTLNFRKNRKERINA